jgi:threonine dehydratase
MAARLSHWRRTSVKPRARTFIHPFDGRNVVLGTSGVGVEFLDQAPDLDAIVVAIGGGGLMAGVAAAVKQMKPSCRVYGVEPIGADVMSRSFRAAAPQRMERIDTIADSLAPPMTTQATYDLCRQFVDDIVTVSDDAICAALALLYREAKLAVEPAGAAAAAAVLGPWPRACAARARASSSAAPTSTATVFIAISSAASGAASAAASAPSSAL